MLTGYDDFAFNSPGIITNGEFFGSGTELFLAVLVLIVVYSLSCCFVITLSDFLYNLIAKMGGAIHIRIAEPDYIST